jgi:sialidase-1
MQSRWLILWSSIHILLIAHAAEPKVGSHIVLYEDAKFYASFPSIVQRPDGELIVAFRRAPERKQFSEGTSHTDPNSYLVQVRSRDGGRTWTREPELIYAHPFGGSQDPCLLQLRNGTILCASYAWAQLQPGTFAKLAQPVSRAGNFAFLGGFLLRSTDGARSWEPPIVPAPCRGELNRDIFGNLIPAYNRGALCEGSDGRLFWVVAATGNTNGPRHTGTHLMISSDRGSTWSYSAPVAVDAKIQFNEASIYETPRRDLVAFIRTAGFNDQTVIARSTDGGRSFTWKDAGFKGHPHFALRLPDRRVLLVYGYRHQPFGIRARVLDAECTNAASAREIVLRDDGGNGDLGYPWATMVTDRQALVVYYFNKANGTRHIAGTFIDLPSE